MEVISDQKAREFSMRLSEYWTGKVDDLRAALPRDINGKAFSREATLYRALESLRAQLEEHTGKGGRFGVCPGNRPEGYLGREPYPDYGDLTDRRILAERALARDELRQERGILVGDWLRMPDASVRRVAHVWPADMGGEVQPASEIGQGGSLYLWKGGAGDYSGGLDHAIEGPFFNTLETKQAVFWFFHHDEARGHNGVRVAIDTPIWQKRVNS